MPTIIDNIELDETNVEFNYAADFVKHTERLVFLTGKAGTGKTTFLKFLKETTKKNTAILAPTGVAAINAGGQTIHSFFQIKPSIYVPNDKRLRKSADYKDKDRSTIYENFRYSKSKIEIIRGLELLIIDEISMVRCDLLDVVDNILRVFRKRESEPFGGVQVVLIGDTFQLPPIAESDQWEILKTYYKSPFFFSSKVVERNKPIFIELKKIYRQNEQEFIDLLNRIRVNQVSANDLKLLNSKYNATFAPKSESNYITLATHNRSVESTNLTKLGELSTELKLFEATVSGTFPEKIMPTSRILHLKEGAQIMFVKNDISKRYYNGKIAKIFKLEDSKIIVELSEGYKILVEKQVWKNIKYTWNKKEKKIEEEIIGTFTQFPLKLAWAITVHKSQGLTFEHVIADLKSAFASGQVYVALSRCTSFSGLILKTRIERRAIITDPQVLKFAKNETPSTLIVQELNAGKANFYYRQVREDIKALNYTEAYENLLKAINFRNDIGTSQFKKYFIVTAKRLASYKRKFFETSTKLENLKKMQEELRLLTASKIEKLGEEIEDYQYHMIKSEYKNYIQTTIIDEHKKTRKSLLAKTKRLEKKVQSLKSDISTMKTDSDNAEMSLLELQNAVQSYVETISNLKEKNKSNIQEIERLRSLKWHQKLFGSK